MIFMPYANFRKSAESLDDFRLQHQRRVAKQMILFFMGELGPESAHLKNHPTLNMWKGHLPALKHHYNTLIDVWVGRGKNNTMEKFKVQKDPKMPWWFGNEKVHKSHRSVLYNKWPAYYGSLFAKADQKYNKNMYWWPTLDGELITIEPKPYFNRSRANAFVKPTKKVVKTITKATKKIIVKAKKTR